MAVPGVRRATRVLEGGLRETLAGIPLVLQWIPSTSAHGQFVAINARSESVLDYIVLTGSYSPDSIISIIVPIAT